MPTVEGLARNAPPVFTLLATRSVKKQPDARCGGLARSVKK
jgi:hypothetical protein